MIFLIGSIKNFLSETFVWSWNMDPETTLDLLYDAMEAEEWEEAQEYLSYLDEWLNKGGFMPRTLTWALLENIRENIDDKLTQE